MADYDYRSETTSPEGFVQHVACNLLPHGYHFFISGRVPDRKDPLAVDRKLLAKYRIDVSPKTRHRRSWPGKPTSLRPGDPRAPRLLRRRGGPNQGRAASRRSVRRNNRNSSES